MRRVTTICCSALAFLALAKAPGPLSLLPLRPVWRLALNSHLTFGPAYDAARAYFPIEGDRLAAYEMLTGKQLWIVDSHSARQPVAVDDLVVVTGPDGIAALRAADGSRAWHVPLEEPLTFKPATARGWLLAPTKSGALVALRTSDGAIAWRRTFTSPPHATPTIRADRFYISLADGRIAAHELKTGEPIWERRVGGSANEILALDERVYAGSTDNFLYCLLAKDGKIDWRWRTGGDVTKAPAADGRAVYFASYDNVVRALSQTSGGQYWMKPLPFRPTSGVLLSGATVVVAGQSPTIKTFNAKDGVPGLDISAGDEVAAAPQILEDEQSHLPMLVIVARHIVNGDSVSLSARSLEPVIAPFAPLANPVTPVPMQATRP